MNSKVNISPFVTLDKQVFSFGSLRWAWNRECPALQIYIYIDWINICDGARMLHHIKGGRRDDCRMQISPNRAQILSIVISVFWPAA